VEAKSWTPPPLFGLLQREGKVSEEEMREVFNLGVGMIAVLPAACVEAVQQSATAAAIGSWVLGEVRPGDTGVRFA
jgi:phosphoribosylformylglycinamidine cyclo-ligase